MEFNEQYFNPPQQRAILAMSAVATFVMGRATGKSEGIGSPILADRIENMPRGAIGIVARTFMQAADRTLPPLYAGWRRMGYHRNEHYWVGEYPPAYLNIPRPLYGPDKEAVKHAIFWYTGAFMPIISQDRPGSANGKTLDFLYGDEAKLLNKQKFDLEIAKASRGNVREFSGYSGHGGTLFLSDMPTTPESKWMHDHEMYNDLWIRKWGKRYKMSDLIDLIINLQLQVNQMKFKLYTETDKVRLKYYKRIIRSDERLLNELRMETAMYGEASSLENAHFIGIKKLRQWKRDDLDVDFRTQVLNERLYIREHGFYPNLDLEHHTYDKYDYDQLDDAGGLWMPDGVRKGCMNDGDIVRTQPLDIAFDAGKRINCMVVGQEHPDEYRLLKSLFVKDPKKLKDLLDAFCEYYGMHPRKEVNFFYDHTFTGTDAVRYLSYADEIRLYLGGKGWKVNPVNIGLTSGHESRYRLWQDVLGEDGERQKPVRFNRENCKSLLISMQCAGTIEGSKGIEKDKRPERRTNVDQAEATHQTDALDTLYIGRFQNQIGYAFPTTSAIF